MHPYLTRAVAAERIKSMEQEAALTRLAKEARRARRAGRAPMLAAAGQASPHSRPAPPAPAAPPAPPVTSRRGVADGRPAAADERRPESTRVA